MTANRQPLAARASGAAAGLVSAGLLLAVAEFVGALTGRPTPLIAVGNAVVRFSPPAVTSRAIEWFGTNDKLVLLMVTVVLVALGAAAAGVVALTRPYIGAAIAGVIAVLGVAGALLAPGAQTLDVIPTIVGAVVAIPTLVLLARMARSRAGRRENVTADASAKSESTRGASRRAFLAVTGAVAVAAAGVAAGGRALNSRLRDAVASRAGVRLPRPEAAIGPELEGAGVSPTTPFRTSNADFYRIDTALSVPQVPAEDWSLRIHGLVDRELTLDWNDLVSRRFVEREITLVCVSNEVGGRLAGNAVWLGTSLGDLLRDAGVADDADMLLSTSTDGFTVSTPLNVALDSDDALIAIGMNGEPLPLEHGFPARMVIAGLYGYVSATKWVTDLKVTRFADDEAFWTPRGYSAEAPIKVASRIDVPQPFAEVPAGDAAVAGVAWAPGRGISTVEVRADEGEWTTATLAPVPGTTTWQQWTWVWAATPGQHRLEVRATDGDGTQQTSDRASIKPDGTTGWHSVVVSVV